MTLRSKVGLAISVNTRSSGRTLLMKTFNRMLLLACQIMVLSGLSLISISFLLTKSCLILYLFLENQCYLRKSHSYGGSFLIRLYFLQNAFMVFQIIFIFLFVFPFLISPKLQLLQITFREISYFSFFFYFLRCAITIRMSFQRIQNFLFYFLCVNILWTYLYSSFPFHKCFYLILFFLIFIFCFQFSSLDKQ